MSTAPQTVTPAIPAPRPSPALPGAGGASLETDARADVGDNASFARQLRRVEGIDNPREASSAPPLGDGSDAVSGSAGGPRRADAPSAGASPSAPLPDASVVLHDDDRATLAVDRTGILENAAADGHVAAPPPAFAPIPVTGPSDIDADVDVDAGSGSLAAVDPAVPVEAGRTDAVPDLVSPDDAAGVSPRGGTTPEGLDPTASRPDESGIAATPSIDGGRGQAPDDATAARATTARAASSTPVSASLADRARVGDVSDEDAVPAGEAAPSLAAAIDDGRDSAGDVTASPVAPVSPPGARPVTDGLDAAAPATSVARGEITSAALAASRDGRSRAAVRTALPTTSATPLAGERTLVPPSVAGRDGVEAGPPLVPGRRAPEAAPDVVPVPDRRGRVVPGAASARALSPSAATPIVIDPGFVDTASGPGTAGSAGTPVPLAPAVTTGTPFATRLEAASSPTVPIAPQNLPLDGRGGAAEELAAGVRWTSGEGRGQAWINVTPAGLGPVAIRVAMEGDQVSVSIAASQAGAREALEPLIPRLREQLAADGHRSVDVDLSGGREDARRQNDAGGDERASPDGGARSGTGRAGNEPEEDATSPVPGLQNGIAATRPGLAGGVALVDSWA